MKRDAHSKIRATLGPAAETRGLAALAGIAAAMLCLLCSGVARAGEGAPARSLGVWYWSVPGQRPAADGGMRPDRVYVEAGHVLAGSGSGPERRADGARGHWRIEGASWPDALPPGREYVAVERLDGAHMPDDRLAGLLAAGAWNS